MYIHTCIYIYTYIYIYIFTQKVTLSSQPPRHICLDPKAFRTSCRETLPSTEAKVLKACLGHDTSSCTVVQGLVNVPIAYWCWRREWMGMREWDFYDVFIHNYDGSFPHSLLSTSKIQHHPTIGDITSNNFLKLMSKVKQGHLPTPVVCWLILIGN